MQAVIMAALTALCALGAASARAESGALVEEVGAGQSTVSGGTVSREKVECDGGRLTATGTEQSATGSGALVIRSVPRARTVVQPRSE